MKRIMTAVVAFVLVLTMIGYATETNNDDVSKNSSVELSSQEKIPEPDDIKLSFTITAGEAGEYGKMVTYNKGTEFEENFYAYFVPAGTYEATNKGRYMSQINVYSDEIIVNEDGWEEPKSIGGVKLLDVGKTDTITIEEGYHIEIAEPSVFELKQK